ncbi:MAG: FeoA family protein [Actinomycetota bacterium]|nr:FeoA family protein [Actinomycetota bacterium]
MRLGEMKPGMKGRISGLSCRGRLRRRLMDMGIVSGVPVEIVRAAPLGDPVELKVKDFYLSLRKDEAGDIWIEVEDESE